MRSNYSCQLLIMLTNAKAHWQALAVTAAVLAALSGCSSRPAEPQRQAPTLDFTQREPVRRAGPEAAAAAFVRAYLSYSWRDPLKHSAPLVRLATPELAASLASGADGPEWDEVVRRRMSATASVETAYVEEATPDAVEVTVVAAVRAETADGASVRRELVVVRVVLAQGRWLVAGLER